MKLMFISDIHGIKTNIQYIKNKFNELKCDKLIVLGDLYHHGYSIYKDIDNDYILNFLNNFNNRLICLKGNCDTENDLKISSFPIIKDITTINVDSLNIYMTHGNIYNINNPYKKGILIYGHEHKPYIIKKEDNIYINTGSISLPRTSIKPSYVIYENKTFTIYDIEDKIINSITIN